MKKLLLLGLCLTTTVVNAECYMRSSIKLTNQSIQGIPTDLQKLAVPEKSGYSCTIRYRVSIGNNWQTVEGTAQARTENEACARALDYKKGYVLAEVTPKTIQATNHMICTDLPDIQVRSVKIGEVVWESETDKHNHPDEQKYFTYKRTQCRMFVERAARFENLYTYQGIICRQNATQYSKWQVVDKY